MPSGFKYYMNSSTATDGYIKIDIPSGSVSTSATSDDDVYHISYPCEFRNESFYLTDDQRDNVRKEAEKIVALRLTIEAQRVIEEECEKVLTSVYNLKRDLEDLKKIHEGLKSDIEKVRNEIKDDAKEIEHMLRKYCDGIFRYQIMDI